MRCDCGDSPSLAGDAVSICEVLEPTGVNVFIVPGLWAPSLIVGLYSAEAGSRHAAGGPASTSQSPVGAGDSWSLTGELTSAMSRCGQPI